MRKKGRSFEVPDPLLGSAHKRQRVSTRSSSAGNTGRGEDVFNLVAWAEADKALEPKVLGRIVAKANHKIDGVVTEVFLVKWVGVEKEQYVQTAQLEGYESMLEEIRLKRAAQTALLVNASGKAVKAGVGRLA
eukprot:GHVU01007333.1.p4 GENE.GHVU01007333.1~~GHVU01007333.1.p4  ORF type:complete len:133 (-),score=16.92 GHVU01007333.1:1711-2109(-)